MFSRILVANRGEIALRIIRACRELGIETVAVFSKADENARYLRHADDRVCIGPPPSEQSYLNIPSIISAAEITDVEAIHPGYGFLSESSHFAEICESSNITFIGPSSKAMQLMGNKSQARKVAIENKIPVIPGSASTIANQQEALDIAHKIGYPVLIKAAAGGGGRGMRIAHNDASLVNALAVAQREAEAAFKDSSIYIEKYIERARHVEVQILADQYGNMMHLGERDCSLQRRHQKLLEETPSPGITPQLRGELYKAALKIAKAVNYTNVGTVEFLVDENGKFYFIEMNTRLQVEHPITEMVTGIDLVKEQIKIAAGEPLKYRQKHVRFDGVAIECRIYAEDPDNGFRPHPGRISTYHVPGGKGVRVDSHVHQGYEIPPFYDSLISKLIVHQATRQESIACLKRALEEYVIEGVKTTLPLHMKLLNHTNFLNGNFTTTFVEGLMEREQ
ncbi:MAG TPA: acetyl-CoA carboxylase biotin carboxylase subunit [Candidatus Hypogeohydataceae bacterium YC41]